MTEQNNATPGSNPRMWQGREIENDMPIAPMRNYSDLSEREIKLLKNQPPYWEMRRQVNEMTTEPIESAMAKSLEPFNYGEYYEEPEPVRPTPGTLKKSLDSQKRNKAEQERRARQRAFVATTHLTHRPFRAALADFNSKEKS